MTSLEQLHLSLLRWAAPERADEFNTIIKEAEAQVVLAADRPGFQLETAFGGIMVGNRTPAACWIIAHAGWQCISAYAPAALSGHIDSAQCAMISEQSEHVAKVAARLATAHELLVLESAADFDWPSEVPKPEEVASDVEAKAVRDIAGIAWAFVLLHELSHAHIRATGKQPESALDEEHACDRFSISFLLDHVEEYAAADGKDPVAVRALRSMGIMTGLFAISVLGKDADGIHPPPRERLQCLFTAVGGRPVKHFWLFAVTLVLGAIEARGRTVSERNLTLDQVGATALARQL